MAFIETPRFPDEVAAWLVGGEVFASEIVVLNGGAEQVNIIWSMPLRKYNLSAGLREIKNIQATIAFFRGVAGRGNGFRVKIPWDYLVDITTGVLGTAGVGTGYPTYQLYKKYITGAISTLGIVPKPVAGTVAPYRNASPMVAGSGAGQYSIDNTLGIVSAVADSTSAVANLAVGANTVVTLTANLPTLTANAGHNLLYLSGMTGNDAALLNGIAHTVISSAAPAYTISTNTAGKAIDVSGSGYLYPQTSDTLTWAGEFDIPIRNDNDWLQIGMDPAGLMNWTSITLFEKRI